MTQVLLQPSSVHTRLKSHPLSNELATVTALGQWSPLQSKTIALMPEMEGLHAQKTRREMAHPGLTKGFLHLSPEAAMLPGPRVV